MKLSRCSILNFVRKRWIAFYSAWVCFVTIGLYGLSLGVSYGSEVSCARDAIDAKVAEEGKGNSHIFLEELAEQGCIWSYFHLADQDKSGNKSYVWNLLVESARLGDERSMRRLGSFHSFGVGVKKDYIKAYALYRLAAYLGDKGTNFLAKKLSLNMEESEIEEAEHIFEKWREDYKVDGKVDKILQ